MNLGNLDNLVKSRQLKVEAFDQKEFDGLVKSAQRRFVDANNASLSIESRFDLAYNAAHSFALAALRRQGYRAENRYIVFQVLPHTLGLGPEVWRVLTKCHERRNVIEYEGYFEIEEQLLEDLLVATKILRDKAVKK